MRPRPLHFTFCEYPPAVLKEWPNRGPSTLPEGYVKEILTEKFRKRPDRFFGEAFIAKQRGHEQGWYGSYKWLTASRWCQAPEAEGDTLRDRFQWALHQTFGAQKLQVLQERTQSLKPLLLDGRIPVPPDLWLIDSAGRHHFIEVKVLEHDDSIKDAQLAGFAVLATAPVRIAISLEVVFLHEKGVQPSPRLAAKEKKWKSRFDYFCEALS